MKGFPGGMQQFMKQYNQLQSKIKKLQEDLDAREFSASSGGGAVNVTVVGKSTISELEISEEAVKSGDGEMIQDLVMTATNEALRVAQETYDKEMEKVGGGMSMPGLF